MLSMLHNISVMFVEVLQALSLYRYWEFFISTHHGPMLSMYVCVWMVCSIWSGVEFNSAVNRPSVLCVMGVNEWMWIIILSFIGFVTYNSMCCAAFHLLFFSEWVRSCSRSGEDSQLSASENTFPLLVVFENWALHHFAH